MREGVKQTTIDPRRIPMRPRHRRRAGYAAFGLAVVLAITGFTLAVSLSRSMTVATALFVTGLTLTMVATHRATAILMRDFRILRRLERFRRWRTARDAAAAEMIWDHAMARGVVLTPSAQSGGKVRQPWIRNKRRHRRWPVYLNIAPTLVAFWMFARLMPWWPA